MQTSFWTVRRKMLIPALAAVAATVLATGVTAYLSARATRGLQEVEDEDFPVLRFNQTMLNSLKELHLLLLNVGEAESMDGMDIPDDLHQYIAQKIQSDGPKVLGGEAAVQKLQAELEGYFAAARALAVERVQAQLKTKRAIARATSDKHIYSDSTAEERAIRANRSAVENKYGVLYDRFTGEVDRAGAAMTSALAGAKSDQWKSVIVGAAILLASAILAGLAAWLIAKRASRPLRTLSEVALRVAEGDLTRRSRSSPTTRSASWPPASSAWSPTSASWSGPSSAPPRSWPRRRAALRHTRAQSAMLEQQASGVAETSSTTRELEQTSSVAASRAASVLEVARRAAEMSDAGRTSAEKSAGELQRIQASVETIVGQSSGLLDQARQVGDIVETVRDLATQSHVLSLNASIEAAKAGEAGKGFGVVAQEVRALAEQSGESASRIGKIVEDMLSAVQSTRDMTERGSKDMTGSLAQVRSSGESLREIGSIVRETSDAALQIASAVQQQSTGIAQIASAMRDLDKGMEETIGRIRSLEISSQQVAETATRISAVAAEFTV